MATTDMTEAQWARVAKLLPPPNKIGRPQRNNRQIINGIRFVLGTAASWRDIPRDTYGPWQTVYHRYNAWRKEGMWEQFERAFHGVDAQQVANRPAEVATV